ncbi:MAG: hypothetical protein O2955_05885 [Planctomycetota bacterium]|nr:hypothetical protein [Planctomycetota bacterium]MDA1212024.1 hypothetical protein [Planctomycetota bacterium]
MSDTYLMELNEQQREVILQGLRYVKSSLRLDVYDPTPELVEKRQRSLQEVFDLETQLQTSRTGGSAANV